MDGMIGSYSTFLPLLFVPTFTPSIEADPCLQTTTAGQVVSSIFGGIRRFLWVSATPKTPLTFIDLFTFLFLCISII